MTSALPACQTLALTQAHGRLDVRLNRPEARNAMNRQMVGELTAVFDAIRDDRDVRFVVLRGNGGSFCAGGDVKDMAGAGEPSGGIDPLVELNRSFGALIDKVNRAPQLVIAVLEGPVLGGGLGLACVSDVALAMKSARFGLPETSLGLPPAQIAPFLVQRIGLTRTRRLALTGARFDGEVALALGLVHELAETVEELEARLEQTLTAARNCAPGANAVTKAILVEMAELPLNERLDAAARLFAGSLRGEEGREGTSAFIAKRPPRWSQP